MITLKTQIPLIFILFIAGCATQRTSLPEIEETPRTGLNLETPILFSIVDARTNKEDSEEHIQTLRRGLENTYTNCGIRIVVQQFGGNPVLLPHENTTTINRSGP